MDLTLTSKFMTSISPYSGEYNAFLKYEQF